MNKRRKLRVTGAKALKAIRVSGLPRGRYTLEVRVKTRDGRTERSARVRIGRARADFSLNRHQGSVRLLYVFRRGRHGAPARGLEEAALSAQALHVDEDR